MVTGIKVAGEEAVPEAAALMPMVSAAAGVSRMSVPASTPTAIVDPDSAVVKRRANVVVHVCLLGSS